MATFTAAFKDLLIREGGFVNHPLDPGGATNKGIILKYWKQYGYDKDGDQDIDVEDLKQISDEDAYQFYKQHYWDVIKGDDVAHQLLAEIMFDHGVNAGAKRSVMMIQELLNRHFNQKLAVDGKMGPKTLSTLNRFGNNKLYQAFKDMRIKFYRHRTDDLFIQDRDTLFFTNNLKLYSNPTQRAESLFKRLA